LAFDSSGHLFVANNNGNVTEYASPYTGAPIATISNGVNWAPVGLAFDSSGNLFVGNGGVLEYAPPFSNTSAPIATISNGAGGAAGVAILEQP
ncbi:MAG: hypothetical protein M1314_02640, partial [Firmicutes bacterium]|nr:hypothetical protein [Bacillota bacterium]